MHYYGPGIHAPADGGKIFRPQSGDTIYLAGGAILKGNFDLKGVENVRIMGRGLIYNTGRAVEIDQVIVKLGVRGQRGRGAPQQKVQFGRGGIGQQAVQQFAADEAGGTGQPHAALRYCVSHWPRPSRIISYGPAME